MEIFVNEPAHLDDFVRLNTVWITRYFQLEPPDLALFANPAQVFSENGFILSVVIEGTVVGVCALVCHENREYELAKMAVDERFQGRGLGNVLMQAALDQLRNVEASKVLLITNSQLIPAVEMYRKFGFVTIWEGPHPEYSRGDLVMEKELQAS